MSVRQSLLAILAQGPCYGYQLRAEFEQRTGGVWPLNVGQIYNTLERLERDGLVEKGNPDDHGHVYYSATPEGRDHAAQWLTTPVADAPPARDELILKLSLASTLPGLNAAALLMAERAAASARRTAVNDASPEADADIASILVHDAMLARADSELAWLDRVAMRLAEHDALARTRPLSDARPRRGRPKGS